MTAFALGRGDIYIDIGNGQSVKVLVYVRQVPTTLTVTPDALTLDVGQTVTLQAAMSDANGYEIQVDDGVRGGNVVKWESSDSAVATVEGVGLVFNGKETGATATVTAVGDGTVTITGSWLDLTTSVTNTTTALGSARSTGEGATLTEQVQVTVAPRAAPNGARMEVSPTELIFTTFGETQTVSIRFYDENGNEIEHPTPTISSLVDGVVEWRSVPGGLEVTALG